jgi:hypothetical protein
LDRMPAVLPPTRESRPSESLGGVPVVLAKESSVSGRLVSSDPSPGNNLGFDTGFGKQLIERNSRGPKTAILIGGFAAAIVAVGVVAYKAGGSKNAAQSPAGPAAIATGSGSATRAATATEGITTGSATAGTGSSGGSPPVASPGLENTGFDLYVAPSNIAISSWRLDGQSREVALPSRIRNVAPGPHTITIDAPVGLQSKTETVVVELNKAPKVVINLEGAEFLGVFEADPAGTQVTLLADGKRISLGTAPATAKLVTNKAYQVLFEKTGYVAVNLPVAIVHPRSVVAVTLERTGNVGAAVQPRNNVRRPDKPAVPTEPSGSGPDTSQPDAVSKPILPPPPGPAPGPAIKVDGQSGLIGIMSKPPCDIFIDGTAINRKTPVRDLKLPVGKHKITLVNNEFSIRDSFMIDVKSEANPKVLKDYSDKLVPATPAP